MKTMSGPMPTPTLLTRMEMEDSLLRTALTRYRLVEVAERRPVERVPVRFVCDRCDGDHRSTGLTR